MIETIVAAPTLFIGLGIGLVIVGAIVAAIHMAREQQ